MGDYKSIQEVPQNATSLDTRIVGASILALLSLSVLAAVDVPGTSGGTAMNIYVALDTTGSNMAIQYDSQIHEKCPSDDIYLNSTNQPHITLYLTNFKTMYLRQVKDAVANVVSSLPPLCTIQLSGTSVNDTYAFWEVEWSSCLQYMSDAIVNATYVFIQPNQPIPAWVYDLPPDQQEEKKSLIQTYGSPNVFSQFQPHVTLAYDANAEAENLTAVVASLTPEPIYSYNASMIGLGSVGNYGTILRGQDRADFTLAVE